MSTTDLIARGLITTNKAQLASTADGEGSGKIGYSAAAATSSTRTVQDKLREIISVKDYGAKGDGVTNDTAAIQSAINAAITVAGGSLYFPIGTYRITAKLTIPLSYGWRIFGESRNGVVIRQHTANTRIFSLESDNMHSWTIETMTLEWNTAQPATNTQAIAIYMSAGFSSFNGFHNWQVRDVHFNKGFRGIAPDSTYMTGLWGFRVENCLFNAQMSGAGIFAIPAVAVGQPNISISNCYFLADGLTEPGIRIGPSDSVLLQNIEFNHGAFNPTGLNGLIELYQCEGTLIGCRMEGYAVGSNVSLQKYGFVFTQGTTTCINCTATGITGSNGAFTFLQGAVGNKLSVINAKLGSGITAPGGAFPYGTGGAGAAIMFVSGVLLLNGSTGILAEDPRPYLGSVIRPKFNADRRQSDEVTDLGNASVTLTAASDRIQYQNVTLTANRTITLPNAGVYDGMEFHIVRRAATPGAFTLTVSDPLSAVNHTFASGTNGYVKYRAANGGTTWRIIEAGTV